VPRQLNEVKGIEPGVKKAVDAAIRHAEQLGASIDTCELPLSVDYGMPCYYLIAPAEASANLARYDGVRYGLRSVGDDFREMVMATRHDGFGDEVKRRIMLGTYALSSGYYDAYYGMAQRVRTVIKREHDVLFDRFDVLVSPTSPTVAFKIGEKAADPLAMYLSDVLTIPSCIAGLPGMSIPCGLSDGLPVGLQLVGPQFAENTLFRAGHALEQVIGFDYVPERLR
jgi:aspartyl-tRNA(Asn)/glutamyl-tRNA(Gln) amidotransferase subunit A